MLAKSASAAAVLFALLMFPCITLAQEDETYDFDGVADMDPQPDDPTDWMTSVNWSDGGADPLPPFGPEIPDFGTRVEIQTSTFGVDAPEIGPGDEAQAFGVRIGRFGGDGLLTMTGGSLTTADSCTMLPFTCNRRLRVGSADVALPEDRHMGTFNLIDGVVTTDTLWVGSGSQGIMNMSGGEVVTRADLSMDWTFDAGSILTVTGGTVNVGSNLRMYRTSNLVLDGGTIHIAGAAGLGWTDDLITQTPDVSVTISDGLLEANGFLRVGGSVVIDGGILRAHSFNESLSTGTIEINSAGILQFNNSQESVSAVEAFITSGVFKTSEATPLMVDVVDVGGTSFTQISLGAVCAAGDIDCDGDFDGRDFLEWQRGFPATYDASDLADWQSAFGADSISAANAVPEPGSTAWVVLSISTVMVFRTRRTKFVL